MNSLKHRPVTFPAFLEQLLVGIGALVFGLASMAGADGNRAEAVQEGQAATTKDFCALRLTVFGSEGGPGDYALVELVDKDGRVVFRDRTRDDGRLDICDFDFGVYSLRVGSNECFPTTISNISLDLGVPVRLKVLMNGCVQGYHMRNYCKVYFRVASPEGKPLAGVDLTTPLRSQPKKTDGYGRVSSSAFPGETVPFTFSAPGYQDQRIEVSCESVEDIQRKVVMVPAPQE